MKVKRKGRDFYDENGEWLGMVDGDRDWGYCFEFADGTLLGYMKYNEGVWDESKGEMVFSKGSWSYFQDAADEVRQLLSEGMTTGKTREELTIEIQEK